MKTVAVSVRDTLDDGTGDHRVPGQPVPYVVDFVRQLRIEGWWIIILDAWANDQEALRMLFHWLRSNEIPFDDIWQGFGFPVADLYINNRGEKCIPSKP